MSSNLRALWESAGGNAPEHWEFKTIEELLEHSKSISVGVMYPGQDTVGGVPLIKVSDVKNGAIASRPDFCVSEEVDEEYKRTRLDGTELLITLVGNPGDCVVATKEMAGWNAARALAVVRLEDIELRAWLRYVLLSRPAKHLIEARLNTTVQKTLNLKDIRELGLPIPPKNEREEITKVIDAIEAKMLINRQTNQTLEQIAQAIFKSWFVDFEPTRTKIAAKQAGQDPERAAMAAISGKPLEALESLQKTSPEQYEQLKTTAALFPDALVDSELGEIPQGWREGCIGDVAVAKGGYAFKGKSFVEEGNPVVKIKNITGDGRVDLNGAVCIDDDQAKASDRFKLNDGNLLMAMTGATVGKIGFVVTEGKSVYLNQRVAKFESAKFGEKIAWFLYCCFQRDSIFDAVVGAAQGSAQPNISSKGIESTKLVLPSDELINLFCIKTDSLFKKWLSVIDESTILEANREMLLPKLLSGELAIDNEQKDAVNG